MSRFDPIPGGRPPGYDSPEILRMTQPEPVSTRVVRFSMAGRWVTALLRSWRDRDIARCRLCERGRCTARDNSCLFIVGGFIADRDAPLYSIVGAVRQGPSA